MSECRLTVRRDIGSRGRGLWCIEHQDWAPDYSQCRVSILTVRAEAAEAAIQRVRELHPTGRSHRWDSAVGEYWFEVCSKCGGAEYPCDTIRALDGGEPGV